jgi:putative SOS response-associated peptidase YedK
MCYNYSLNTSVKSLESRFNARLIKEIKLPVYHANAFAFGEMPVITNTKPHEIDLHFWGLIPSWIKNDQQAETTKKYTLNAKCETIFDKPSFRTPILEKRCLIPATGYFEWQHNNKEKIPYHIYIRDAPIFSFAGIWDSYRAESGEEIKTFSILTTEADEFNALIHNSKKRMPLIIEETQEKEWLNSNLSKEDIKSLFAKKELKFEAYKVNKILGSAKHNTNVGEILNREETGSNQYNLFN